jgi:hypothetical protein
MQAEGLRDKAKKARKPGRTREEENSGFMRMRLAGRTFVPSLCSSVATIVASMCITVHREK